MLLRTIYDEKLAQAAYLIGCQRTGEALIIDPQRDVERYIDIAKREGLRITAVTETHIHADFLSGAREMAERTGAKLYLSDEGDADWKYQWADTKQGGGSYDHQLLHNGDRFMVGNIQIEAVHTPGHTPEHLSYLVTDLGGGATEPIGIASGDFVFVGDVGRPDLLESAAGTVGAKEPAARTLYQSLKGFVELPEYLQVWPGHGAGSACGKALGAVPQSTVGYEKRFNSAVVDSLGDEEKFVESILSGQSEPPLYFSRMKRENKLGPAVLGKLPEPKKVEATEIAALSADRENVVVIDTRPWDQFRMGHLPGSLDTPLNKTFPTVVGSYVEPGDQIYLVVDSHRVAEAAVDLVHVGLDNVAGYITPEDLVEYLGSAGSESTANMTVDEFVRVMAEKAPVVLDVRNAGEFEAGHIDGAMNIAHTRLALHLDRLPKEQTIYVHCLAGSRSAVASAFLQRNGFDVVNVAGGYNEIAKSGLPIVKELALAQ